MHRKYMGLAIMLAASSAKADSAIDTLLQNGKISGDIRNYYFTRNYAGNTLTNLHIPRSTTQIRSTPP